MKMKGWMGENCPQLYPEIATRMYVGKFNNFDPNMSVKIVISISKNGLSISSEEWC